MCIRGVRVFRFFLLLILLWQSTNKIISGNINKEEKQQNRETLSSQNKALKQEEKIIINKYDDKNQHVQKVKKKEENQEKKIQSMMYHKIMDGMEFFFNRATEYEKHLSIELNVNTRFFILYGSVMASLIIMFFVARHYLSHRLKNAENAFGLFYYFNHTGPSEDIKTSYQELTNTIQKAHQILGEVK